MSEKDCFIITGSSGLLGHALAHRFGSKDNQVIGFDQEGPPYPPPNTECLFCDLTSDESVQKTFFMVNMKYGRKIKAVFHLAAYYSFSGEESDMYEKLTVKGTERLLRELQNFDVGQFIFSSSMLVYKPSVEGEKLTEDSAIDPTWAYPKSKVDTEELIKEKRGDIPTICLRIAGVYDDVCQSIPLAHQIQRIYERRLEGHLYSGDIDVRQSFVHLNDVTSVFEDCVNNADKLGGYEVFNIGEEDTLTYDETQRIIAEVLYDENWPTIDVPKPIAKAGAWVEDKLPTPEKPFIKPWMIDRADDNYEVDCSRARTVLGWEPMFTLRETLPKMLNGLKLDPKRWYEVNKLHMTPRAEKQEIYFDEDEVQPIAGINGNDQTANEQQQTVLKTEVRESSQQDSNQTVVVQPDPVKAAGDTHAKS